MIKLSGELNETFDPRMLVEVAEGVVVLDLDQVPGITSSGVREWMRALAQLNQEYLAFVNCRPSFVAQFNMIDGFAGAGHLLSFYLPYVCPRCGEYFEVLLDLRKKHDVVAALSVPEERCRACGELAEFDDVPETYLAYAASAPVPRPPPLVDSLLDGSALSPIKGLRMEKHIEGKVTALWLYGCIDKAAHFKRLAAGLEGDVVLMADGVTATAQDGLNGLRTFLSTEGLSLHLARVPPALYQPLAADPSLLGRAVLISTNIPFHCSACGATFLVEADALMLKVLDDGKWLERSCTACGALQSQQGLPDPALKKLSHRAGTEAVREYVYTHDRAKPKSATTPAGVSRSTPLPEAGGGARMMGRYELLRLLGTGGMAEVFLARQTSAAGFEKKVVIKRILPQYARDAAFITMFFDEARVAARISHPNVVQIFDLAQADEQYFIAMEYVRGWDLNAVLRVCTRLHRPLPVALATRVIADIAAGLYAAHTCMADDHTVQPIIHRDVSPHNVLISTAGQVKITDFGIAKAVDNSSRTPTAVLKGKTTYMAPEQIHPERGGPDPRADLFPLGIIYFQLLTLEHLFKRETEYLTLRALMYDPVPEVSTRRKDAPPQVQAILEKALARRPEQRYQTALELQQDCEKLLLSLGQPAGSAELAAWLGGLHEDAKTLGHLAPQTQFTPSAQRASLPPAEEEVIEGEDVTGLTRSLAGPTPGDAGAGKGGGR